MSETEADEILDKLYDNGKSKRDESIQKTADDIAEVYSADERMEVFDAETDENGNIIEGTEEEVTEEVRDDDGNLFHEIAEPTENKDGTYSTEMVFGDPSKESENNYGYVKLTINDDNNSVTIDEFKTGMKRGNLRNEMFADVAKQFSGYDIVWNPKGKLAQSIKDEIVSLNPQGKEAGLNYFNQNAVTNADTKARQMALRQLTENTKLQPSERAGIVAIMGAIAKNQNKSFSDWYNGTFYNGQMFGDVKELYDNVAMQSEQDGTKIKPAGGMKIKDTIDGARAVIYAAENADFSTLAHELSHVWQKQLFGQDAADAARIFGASEVRDADGNVSYDWSQKTIKTKGIDKNGNPIYISPAENFAYSFEKWLKDGKAPSAEQENIFKKFAQFMKNVIETLRNYIDMKPEISDYFNKNFKVTDEMMQTAENEAADFNADGSTKPTNKVAENVASQETTETSENITKSGENLTENDEALSDDEIETLVSDFSNEELKTLIDAGLVSEDVAQAVKETKLDDVTQAAVASILDDPSIPQEKKIEAVMKANGESFLIKQQNIERYQARTDLTAEEKKAAIDDILNNRTTDRNGGGQALSTLASGKDMLFQIIGTQGAQALDEANEETFRMDNQRIAEEMEKAGKDARTIRMATGWERGADGEWKYEIDDRTVKLLLGQTNFF